MVKTRNPQALWEALNALVGDIPGFADDLEIKLVGSVDFSVMDSIAKAGLAKFVNRIAYLQHSAVVKVQQQSQVLLLLINDTPNAKVILPGKFFEYMAAKRPILCIGPLDGDAAQVIADVKAGMVVDKDNQQEMQMVIRELYLKFKSKELSINSKDIEKFSRKSLTEKMAERLREIAN